MPARTLTRHSGGPERPHNPHARVRPYLFHRPASVWCRACGTSLAHPEFATNALLHSRSGDVGGHFTVTTEVEATRALVSVTDQGTDEHSPPRWGQRPDPLAEHGRGLMLVAAMAHTWTTITHQDHCTVTAGLPLSVPVQRRGAHQ